jgi:hypothetical protein
LRPLQHLQQDTQQAMQAYRQSLQYWQPHLWVRRLVGLLEMLLFVWMKDGHRVVVPHYITAGVCLPTDNLLHSPLLLVRPTPCRKAPAHQLPAVALCTEVRNVVVLLQGCNLNCRGSQESSRMQSLPRGVLAEGEAHVR